MFFRFVLFFLLSVLPELGFSQYLFQEDPIKLEEVRVTSERLRAYAVGATLTAPDSSLVKMHRDETLASLLAGTSGVTLKTYGAGGLASVSLRGGGSDHTAVMWNGLNIQSPMNGGVNLAVMPVHFFNHVEVQHGGSGTLFGSGAVSGVVHLSGNDLFQLSNSVTAGITTGSFGHGAVNAGFKAGGKNFATRLSVFGQKADNDFVYTNTSRIDHPEETQTNAGVEQYGVLQENHWRLSDRAVVTTGVWYQNYDKDLQTLMTSRGPNDTNQKDENIMASVNYKYYRPKSTLIIKQGLIYNQTLYYNPDLVDPESDNNSVSWISELEFKHRIGRHHSVNGGLNYTRESARSNGYTTDVVRNRVALFASGRFGLNEGLGALVLSFRNELSDGNTQPLVVSLGVEHDLLNKFRVKGNVSRNYRIPNLNDIYWREDGYAKGNPDLVAESGWSGDVGLSFKTDYQNFNLEVNSAFFASQTHDLIVWLPEDGGKWMPHNKRKGEVQGLEAGMDISTAFGDSEIHGKIFFTHTRSMLFSSDEYDGQEMVYIPRNQMSFSGGYARNSLYAALGGRYAGGRFYDFENTLDPYVLFDTSLGYIFALPAFSADLSFKINNVLDTNYQVVAWYAMPPRNYRITLSLTI